MQSIPTDLDELFVSSYKVNKNNKIKHLRVVFTTLRLLELAMKNKLIASDGTYKLNCLSSIARKIIKNISFLIINNQFYFC